MLRVTEELKHIEDMNGDLFKIEWELMQPSDIEVRPLVTKNGKSTLALYQNSRTTMDALDRKFGNFGWKIEYKTVGDEIYGRLSIKNPDNGEWIYKEDTGEESNISKEKGRSSDILKRVAVRFGYGRELYTAPKIIVDDDGYGNYGYKVSDIQYDENRNIIALTIVNKFGQVAYTYPQQMNNYPQEVNNNSENNTVPNSALLREFCTVRKNCGEDLTNLTKFFNYYKDKVDGFAKCNPQNLWNKWNSKN